MADEAIPGVTPENERHTKLRALRAENEALRRIAADLHWMARRYADGRSTYAPHTVNTHARALVAMGVKLSLCDGAPWARDAMGRAYDGLSDEEAAAVREPSGMEREVWSELARSRAENERLRAALQGIRDLIREDVVDPDGETVIAVIEGALEPEEPRAE